MKKQILFIFALLYCINSFASTRYVKPNATGNGNGSSWVNASADIQAMINASVSNDQIWVAAGTYLPTQIPFSNNNPTDPRHRTFYVKDSVKIYGGFVGNETLLTQRNWVTNLTVLSGDFNNDDIGFTNNTENAYHVILSVRDSANTIDGFTIKGGNANGTSFNNNLEVETEIVEGRVGGGIANYKSNISLKNLIISNNTAQLGAGVYGNAGNPTISNVTINNNAAFIGGGMYNQNDSNPILINVAIKNNTATNDGGGIYNSSSNPSLSNVIITGNTAGVDGGGINNYASSPSLNNVVFSGNVAGNNGGGMFNTLSSSPILRNIVISGNTAATGGGISNNSSTPSLINVSIIGNAATSFGAGMQNLNANPFLINCIVWGNTGGGTQGINNNSSTPNITHCDIQDSLYADAGPGNISINPIFINSTNAAGADGIWLTADDGLQLANCLSPCVNTAANSGAPALDILGNDINAGIKDMGAYEFIAPIQTPISISTTDTILYVKKGATGNGSSWANAMGEVGNALNSIYNVPANVIKRVWVAQGTYTPLFAPSFVTCLAQTNPKERTFYLKNNIKMYGGFTGTETLLSQRNWVANPTILSGDFNNDDVGFTNNNENADHVVLTVNDSSSTVLDGFTIKAGNANLVNNSYDAFIIENMLVVTLYGGGIYSENSNANFANMIIKGNEAYNWGGGLYNHSFNNIEQNLKLNNVSINGNKVTNSFSCIGGGIYNRNATLTINNSSISSNNALTGLGGGIANISAKLILNGDSISNNNAGTGGGIYKSLDSLFANNVIINNNTSSTSGGGMLTTTAYTNLSNVTISNNNAYLGGGMFIDGTIINPTTTILNNVDINNNTAGIGGGMHIRETGFSNLNLITNTSLNNTIIRNNRAASTGGGMYIEIANPTLKNVIIGGNSAQISGGGIYNFGGNTNLTNVTINGNSAQNSGGAMYNYNYPIAGNLITIPILKNTIVWGNTGGGNQGIFNNGAMPLVTYSNIQDSLYAGAGNISSDPLFTYATYPAGADSILLTADDGLQLSCASPCINTGTNTGTPVLDVLGNGIFGGTKDMGAYEIQSSSSTTLASNNQTTLQNVNNNIFTATSCILIAKVVPVQCR